MHDVVRMQDEGDGLQKKKKEFSGTAYWATETSSSTYIANDNVTGIVRVFQRVDWCAARDS